MIQLPPNLNHFREDAEKSLANRLVKDTEFSGSTYQVLVEDLHTGKEHWAFIQLGAKEQVVDAFCSCEEGQSTGGCLHLVTAYLSLFNEHPQPLHIRFFNSLWNHLCQLFEGHLGGSAKRLVKLQEGHYIYRSGMDKILFAVKAKTEQASERLENLIHKEVHETEETSLKFSNLPPEEIALWRAGRPSLQLRYDLSYWSDLAKWLMHLQEDQQEYHVEFRYSKKNLPNWIQISFQDLDIGFYLSEADLPAIIPSLATVTSPLVVRSKEKSGIESISYDKKKGTLLIKASRKDKKVAEESRDGIQVGNWTFVSDEGFYADEPHALLGIPMLEGEELSQALTEHQRLIGNYLKEAVIHQDPVSLSYQLHFDFQWNLHIQAYLFTKGDLSGHSRIIGDWLYLDSDGFYPLESKRFDKIETVILIQHISDFVSQHRGWLNTQTGFQTHVKSIEYQLAYNVSQSNRLTFMRTIAKDKGAVRIQDFGVWVYVEGSGFYSKTSGPFNYLLQKGVSLSAEQIPLFIKMNRDELGLIPKFFAEESPIAKAALKIELGPKNSIVITPEYELKPGYSYKEMRLFDEFIYMEKYGFTELPVEMRLPEKYRSIVTLEGEERDPFLTFELETLRRFTSYVDTGIIKPKKKTLVTDAINKAPEKGRGWYHFNFSYQTEYGLISIVTLRQAINKKQTFAFTDGGLIDLRESDYDWIRRLSKDQIEKSGKIFLSTIEFMRLNAFYPIVLIGDSKESQDILSVLTKLETDEEPNMGGLSGHLRPYQELGVKWLWFLYRHQLSGLLCDDMGLGKTHQAMALMASVSNMFKMLAEGTPCHFLIVCPTSVIYHWEEKLSRFLPGLRVCTFYGTKRSLEAFQHQYDILLTSYGVLRNEKELLAQVPFEVAIFDEIQIAKNQMSQVYGALTKIKAQLKLGLTGTPIENKLRELKSLFDIVLPAYMPSESEYKELFIKPIEKEGERKRKSLLHRLIHPFTLRRKKEDVLKDLPEKIEEVSYCDLSPHQHLFYSEVLEQRRRHLIEELKNDSNPIPFLHVFALLSSLKQICDHPAVYLKKPDDYKSYHSGKWELFVELLREARESQQKVVVFSQYLNMLDIIENYLTEQEIGFASLRGATINRKAQLQYFNQDPKCEVFVGSLHAAGLGIDLTAGSVVIHYDRWWNAARENQATDRVHRIGQTRGVQVFKLVTKGTFEEKIDAMIARKAQLMDDIIKVDDQTLLKTFSRDELIELLSLTKLQDTEEHPTISDVE